MERLKRLFQNKYLNYAIYAPLIVCVFTIGVFIYLVLSFVLCTLLLQPPMLFFDGYEKIPHVLVWSIGVFSLISGLSVVLIVAKKLVFEYMEDKKRKECYISNNVKY